MNVKNNGVLVFLIVFYIARIHGDKDQYTIIADGVRSFSNIVGRYRTELDMKVDFKNLKEAIRMIDEVMNDEYQGTAKQRLPDMRRNNFRAYYLYETCVNIMFEWCTTLHGTVDIFTPYLEKKDAADTIAFILDVGQKKNKESIDLLEKVQYTMAELENVLASMVHDLHYDFGPEGIYKNESRLRRKKRFLFFISFIFDCIIRIVKGPVGKPLQLCSDFQKVGLEKAVEEPKTASHKQQVDVIKSFFNMLNERVTKAAKIAAEVSGQLKEDKINLYKLRGLIVANKNNVKFLLSSNMKYLEKAINHVQNLDMECVRYLKWHGGEIGS